MALNRENMLNTIEDDLAKRNQNWADIEAHIDEYRALISENAAAKNSIYRGKYLGNTVTAEQYTAISSGTFTDLYIGDYWTIGGVNWRIAAFNYYWNTGDTGLTVNHITIVPDTQLYTGVMNDTNTTAGGYSGSKMRTTGLQQAKTTIQSIFGAHLLEHRQLLTNQAFDNKASGWTWTDSTVELLSEVMVYGTCIFGASTLGGAGGFNVGAGACQLPLFAFNPRAINIRQTYWLRDVASGTEFATVASDGVPMLNSASVTQGVRPVFSIA